MSGVLLCDLGGCCESAWSAYAGFRLAHLSVGQVVEEVSLPNSGVRTAINEAPQSVLTHGLEQSVAHASVRLIRADQGLIDQVVQHLEHVAVECGAAARRLDGFQAGAFSEDRHRAKDCLLARSQQAVAPVQGRPHCLLTRWCRSAAAHKQADAVVEAVQDLFDPESTGAGSRQFECQRHTLQPAADAGHWTGIGNREREVGPNGSRTLGEELNRCVSRQLARLGVIRIWNGEGGHRPRHLAGNSQSFPTRGQHAQVGAAV
jgi:hypothetical protein